jgi:hypothetical protein
LKWPSILRTLSWVAGRASSRLIDTALMPLPVIRAIRVIASSVSVGVTDGEPAWARQTTCRACGTVPWGSVDHDQVLATVTRILLPLA